MSITKGQLIIRCLKHLGEYDPVYGEDENDNRVMIDDSFEISAKEEYADRVLPIIESINRAFHRLGQMKKLPTTKYEITYDSTVTSNTIKVPSSVSEQIMEIKKLLLTDQYGNVYTDIPYYFEGDLVILPNLHYGEKYTLIYQPRYVDINVDTDDTSTIDYPDYVIQCIPYFVKADLYEEDDARISNLERNTFEAYASQISTRNESQGDPIDVYGIIGG